MFFFSFKFFLINGNNLLSTIVLFLSLSLCNQDLSSHTLTIIIRIRSILTLCLHLFEFLFLSLSIFFCLSDVNLVLLVLFEQKKKLARDRYLPTFNYTTTTTSRERNVNNASLIFSFFYGAYLINMLNRFNSQRMRSLFRKRMFNSTYWIIKIRE